MECNKRHRMHERKEGYVEEAMEEIPRETFGKMPKLGKGRK